MRSFVFVNLFGLRLMLGLDELEQLQLPHTLHARLVRASTLENHRPLNDLLVEMLDASIDDVEERIKRRLGLTELPPLPPDP